MRRRCAHAWRALTALSLLLGAATVVLWVRSYRVEDIREAEQIWPLPDDPRGVGFGAYSSHLVSGRGWVQFESLVTIVRDLPHSAVSAAPYEVRWRTAPPWAHVPFGDEPARVSRHFLLAPRTMIGGATVQMKSHRQIALAYGWLVLGFWLLPLWRLAGRYRNRVRRTRGLCPSCGYDLRASPSYCPECGRTSNETNG